MRNSGEEGHEERVLAIDYGDARVGLAVSDPLRLIAHGAGFLENNNELLEKISDIVREKGVSLIIVGMPYRNDGSKGRKALEIDTFVVELSRVTEVPIRSYDESFTSVEAGRIHITGGMRKKKRREKGRVDEMAARLILQGFLDEERGRRKGRGEGPLNHEGGPADQ